MMNNCFPPTPIKQKTSKREMLKWSKNKNGELEREKRIERMTKKRNKKGENKNNESKNSE